MCKWGTDELVEVTIPAELSYTGNERKKMVGIDQCIAPIIKALNEAGIRTDYSCCGHGDKEGVILLHDERVLMIKSPEEVREAGGFRSFLNQWRDESDYLYRSSKLLENILRL